MINLIKQANYLAICIYFEARGESREGKIAVGHVILNRVQATGSSIKDVIYKPWQFSWANQGARPAIGNYDAFIDCMEAAIDCFEERLEGKNLNGADHYYNPAQANPSWADGMQEIAVIGHHRFMKKG